MIVSCWYSKNAGTRWTCATVQETEKEGVWCLLNELHKILEREELTSTQKLILIVLKVIPEDESISFNELAFYTSLTRQTVITNLNKLEDAGLLQVIRNSTNTNSYKVLI